MANSVDRERSIAAYAGEVRAFHAFFGAVLILLAGLHLFVLLPYMQLRTAAPVLATALTTVEQETAAIDEAERAVAASTAAAAQFGRILDAAPADLRRAVGNLVARGRLASGANGDPYKATIRLPREGGPSAGAGDDEVITTEEAVRRQIGQQIEALSVAFDAALEPLRSLKNPPPEITDVVRTAEEGLGRNILALNDVLREAFTADPGFWERLDGPSFAPASARAQEWTKGTAEAQRLFETRLAAAAGTLKSRIRTVRARAAVLQERHAELDTRLKAFATRLSWLPLGLEGWTRLYPLIAGALALTALFRLRRILLLRRALPGIDLDVLAPSWIVGTSTAPGRWWTLVLIALPVAATVHASLVSLRDPGLYTGLLGEPRASKAVAYGALYAAMSGAAIWQLVLVGRGIFSRPPARQHLNHRRV
ncbi:MAG: hypothetical protein QN178_16545 [Armatimonadota bacterium]|nr:hypothetical protein [Armatimonadota bacterium]